MPASPVVAFLIRAYHPHLGALYAASQTFHLETVLDTLRAHLVDFRINCPSVEQRPDGTVVLVDEDLGAVVATVSALASDSEGLGPPLASRPDGVLFRQIRQALG